jgi:hypothetical protein
MVLYIYIYIYIVNEIYASGFLRNNVHLGGQINK